MLFFFKYPNFNQLSRKERKKRETPSVDAMECITITHNDTVTYLNYFIIGKVLYFGTTYSTKYKNILLVNNQSGFYHHHHQFRRFNNQIQLTNKQTNKKIEKKKN